MTAWVVVIRDADTEGALGLFAGVTTTPRTCTPEARCCPGHAASPAGFPLSAEFVLWAPTYVGAESIKAAPSGGLALRSRRQQVEEDRAQAVLRDQPELANNSWNPTRSTSKTLRAITTTTGLNVHPEFDTNSYERGIRIPDKDMKTPEDTRILTRQDLHGD